MQHNFTGKFFLLSLLLFLSPFVSILAQTTSLYFEDQQVEPATMVSIDVNVADFNSIVGMQFSINWNPDVLEFNEVENFGIEDITLEANFGLDSAGVGRLGFLWIDNTLAGVDLPDSSTLFSIKFMVIGDPNSTCQMIFSDMPTLIEFSDVDDVIETELIGATITVMEPNSLFYNSAPDQIKVIDCYPNPFSARTSLEFQLATSDQLTILIKDAKGKLIYSQQDFFQAGKHQVIFNKDLFPAGGIYFYELVSKRFKVSQKLIHLND